MLLMQCMEPVEDGIDYERLLYKTCRQYEALAGAAVRALVLAVNGAAQLLETAIDDRTHAALRGAYEHVRAVRRKVEDDLPTLTFRPEARLEIDSALRRLVEAQLTAAMILEPGTRPRTKHASTVKANGPVRHPGERDATLRRSGSRHSLKQS